MLNEDLKFDSEFQDVFPRLSDAKLELMSESLKENGLIDELITWNGVLIDGYIRYELCQKLGIPIRYKKMEFESKDDAKFFKIRNQCAQRELTVFQRCELLYSFEDFIAKQVEKQRRKAISAYQQSRQTRAEMHQSINNDESVDTGTAIAKYANTKRRTWYMAKALIEEADEETKKLLRSGELKITPAYQQLRAEEALIRDMAKVASSGKMINDKSHVEHVEALSKPATSLTTQDGGQAIKVADNMYSQESHKADEHSDADSTSGANESDGSSEAENEADDIGFSREAAAAMSESDVHNTEHVFPRECSIHFNMGAPLEAELAAEGDTADSDNEDWSTDDVDIDHDPYISEIDINDPDTHLPEAVPNFPEMPKRNPIPFPLVRQQIQYSVQTMLFDLLVGLCGLRDEEINRRDEILEIVKHGFKKAKKLIERETNR